MARTAGSLDSHSTWIKFRGAFHIDTKFTSVFTYGRFGQETLESGYLYQIYAYLRSQEGQGDACADHAEGVLLHPSIGAMVDESAWVQGHRLRAVTVDLAESAAVIRSQLMRVVG